MTRIPLPPPPADAFTNSGYPTPSAISASFTSSMSPLSSAPGTSGTPAVSAIRLASTLRAIERIDVGVGPTHVRPAAATASANSAFSDRNP